MRSHFRYVLTDSPNVPESRLVGYWLQAAHFTLPVVVDCNRVSWYKIRSGHVFCVSGLVDCMGCFTSPNSFRWVEYALIDIRNVSSAIIYTTRIFFTAVHLSKDVTFAYAINCLYGAILGVRSKRLTKSTRLFEFCIVYWCPIYLDAFYGYVLWFSSESWVIYKFLALHFLKPV